MQITTVHIKGFRNFDDTWIYTGNPSLLIGPNDSGKTNFLTALRLLFDRSYSDMDLDLLDNKTRNAYPSELYSLQGLEKLRKNIIWKILG